MKFFYLPKKHLSLFLFLFLFLSISGCQKQGERSDSLNSTSMTNSDLNDSDVSSESLSSASQAESNRDLSEADVVTFKPFPVYSDKGARDNHYVPSGFMPNGKCLRFDDSWKDDCYDGITCLQIVYDVECSREDQRWAGIYWLNPPNNWGHRKGGFNLSGAKRLTFWARGERGGEQIQEFTMGGIAGDYPDSDIATIGPVILTDQWRKYTMDLRGKDLSYISGGFAWSTNEEVNPEGCVFYLDNIQFE